MFHLLVHVFCGIYSSMSDVRRVLNVFLQISIDFSFVFFISLGNSSFSLVFIPGIFPLEYKNVSRGFLFVSLSLVFKFHSYCLVVAYSALYRYVLYMRFLLVVKTKSSCFLGRVGVIICCSSLCSFVISRMISFTCRLSQYCCCDRIEYTSFHWISGMLKSPVNTILGCAWVFQVIRQVFVVIQLQCLVVYRNIRFIDFIKC